MTLSLLLLLLSIASFTESLKPQGLRVSFILGAPLAGKGTQASLLVKEFDDLAHISAGDVLREERETGSQLAELIESYIKEGSIVPVKITLDLIRKKMEKSEGKSNKFLIDGFPRNLDNYNGWMSAMGDVTVDSVLFIECPKEEIIKRMHIRAQEFGRSDDNLETLEKRLLTFQESTLPVVDIFQKMGLVDRIDAGSRPIDDVYKEVEETLRKRWGRRGSDSESESESWSEFLKARQERSC